MKELESEYKKVRGAAEAIRAESRLAVTLEKKLELLKIWRVLTKLQEEKFRAWKIAEFYAEDRVV